ncbi:hypothetical protein HK405_010021, partial [Cladochytrium tenue]
MHHREGTAATTDDATGPQAHSRAKPHDDGGGGGSGGGSGSGGGDDYDDRVWLSAARDLDALYALEASEPERA